MNSNLSTAKKLLEINQFLIFGSEKSEQDGIKQCNEMLKNVSIVIQNSNNNQLKSDYIKILGRFLVVDKNFLRIHNINTHLVTNNQYYFIMKDKHHYRHLLISDVTRIVYSLLFKLANQNVNIKHMLNDFLETIKNS